MPELEEQSAYYHGSARPIEKITPLLEAEHRKLANSFGPAFYSTDDMAVGGGYTEGTGHLYRVYETNPVKFIDAETQTIPQPVVERVIKRFPEELKQSPDAEEKLRAMLTGTPSGKVFSRFSGETPVSQTVNRLLREELDAEGYGGMRYTGGVRTGAKPHVVKMYWHPERDIAPRSPGVPPPTIGYPR